MSNHETELENLLLSYSKKCGEIEKLRRQLIVEKTYHAKDLGLLKEEIAKCFVMLDANYIHSINGNQEEPHKIVNKHEGCQTNLKTEDLRNLSEELQKLSNTLVLFRNKITAQKHKRGYTQ